MPLIVNLEKLQVGNGERRFNADALQPATRRIDQAIAAVTGPSGRDFVGVVVVAEFVRVVEKALGTDAGIQRQVGVFYGTAEANTVGLADRNAKAHARAEGR